MMPIDYIKDRGDRIIVRPKLGKPFQTWKFRTGICPVCGQVDILYPIQFHVCPSCLQRLHGYTAVNAVPSGYGVCDICGGRSYALFRLHTEVCPRCHRRILAMQKRTRLEHDRFTREMLRSGMVKPYMLSMEEVKRRGGFKRILEEDTRR